MEGLLGQSTFGSHAGDLGKEQNNEKWVERVFHQCLKTGSEPFAAAEPWDHFHQRMNSIWGGRLVHPTVQWQFWPGRSTLNFSFGHGKLAEAEHGPHARHSCQWKTVTAVVSHQACDSFAAARANNVEVPQDIARLAAQEDSRGC